MTSNERGGRFFGAKVVNLLCILLLLPPFAITGCSSRPESPTAVSPPALSAQATYDSVSTNIHRFAAGARGAERERLLTEAAAGYEVVLKSFPSQTNVCLLATRSLANVRAMQGRTDEAVRLHLSVTNSPAAGDMDRLIALKSAGDLLWDANRREEAKPIYEQLVERFGKPGSSQLHQTIARGARTRLESMIVRESL